MLLSGPDIDQVAQWEAIMRGYQVLRDFDPAKSDSSSRYEHYASFIMPLGKQKMARTRLSKSLCLHRLRKILV